MANGDDNILTKAQQEPHHCIMYSLSAGIVICKVCGRVGKELARKQIPVKPAKKRLVNKWTD